MRTNLEFRSDAFPACAGEEEEVNPGRHGKRLVQFLAAELPRHGFNITGVFPEDWGWRLDLQNDAFPLWVGCGNYEEYENGFLCFIEPSKPVVRQWLKSIQTSETVERLATALEQVLQQSDKAQDLRWWTEAEAARG
jgi:hypothetical protein